MTFIEHNREPGKPRAIDTVYKGYKFRSRLEARWAVFLDRSPYKWIYEMEGYQLKSGWYLPDFTIIDPRDGRIALYLEVKPGPRPDNKTLVFSPEVKKMHELAYEHQYRIPVDIVFGDPYDVCEDLELILSTSQWSPLVRSFRESPNATRRAAEIARQARFEHGAQP